MNSTLANTEPTQQSATSAINQALQQAIAHHQAGQLQNAKNLYLAILGSQPDHPDANHNLGVLAIQIKRPAEALPHFKAALEANPIQGQYWLSFIEALIQTGQTEAAKWTLEQAKLRGLQGAAAEALTRQLNG